MTKITFTDAKLKALPIKEKRYAVIDIKEDGLELFIHPKGTKTFCYYKRINGVPKHQKIGNLGDITVAQAREIAMALRNKIKENPYLSKNATVGKLIMNKVFEMYLNSKVNLSPRTIGSMLQSVSKRNLIMPTENNVLNMLQQGMTTKKSKFESDLTGAEAQKQIEEIMGFYVRMWGKSSI